MNNKLVIATRTSPLAQQQALWVKQQILAHYPALDIELLGITTSGDKMQYQEMNKGLFVKELEQALLARQADVAVHSVKDVPMELADTLVMPVITKRVDPRDALIANNYTFKQLPRGAKVGTASLRRTSQLLALRPDLVVQVLRGNLHTRLGRLERGDFDAIVLAAAGLERLGLTERISTFFAVDEMVPAPGQGSLGLECRAGDEVTQCYLLPLHHHESALCIAAERAFCRDLAANCHVPVAAYAQLLADDEHLRLTALVAHVDGSSKISATATAPVASAQRLGARVARMLLDQGAQEVLQQYV